MSDHSGVIGMTPHQADPAEATPPAISSFEKVFLAMNEFEQLAHARA
jgi:hypothetical protein